MTDEGFIHIAHSKFTPHQHVEGCSKPLPEGGFGLAGGGFGAYSYCPECGAILSKVCEED